MSKTYEVTAPDGKVYEVTAPDGATEAEIISYAKTQFSAPEAPKPKGRLNPQQQAAFDDVMKGRPWGSGIPKAAYELGGKVTDATGSPLAGAAANVAVQALPTFATSGRLQDASAGPLLEGPAKWMMQNAVKPTMASRKSGDAGRAMGTMLKENIYPTAGGMDKVAKIASSLDDQVEAAIAGSNAKIPVSSVTSRLEDPMQKFARQVNPQADVAAIEDVWTKFLTNPAISGNSEIPVQLAHQLKKGTYQSLGGKSYGEVGSAAIEGQKALARGLREESMAAVPGIVEPLKRQASLMNVRDVAADRAILEANKNPLGLAALRLDHPLSATMTMADRIAAIKAFLAMQMYGGSKPGVLAPLGTSAGALMEQPEPGILYRR